MALELSIRCVTVEHVTILIINRMCRSQGPGLFYNQLLIFAAFPCVPVHDTLPQEDNTTVIILL